VFTNLESIRHVLHHFSCAAMKTIVSSVRLAISTIACVALCASCSSSTQTLKERVQDARNASIIRHLGKTFTKTSTVDAVYDAQNLNAKNYEVFGEIVILYIHLREAEEIEAVMAEEAKERGANGVILQDLSLIDAGWAVHVRGRLVRYK
jgi:hypothetical protein